MSDAWPDACAPRSACPLRTTAARRQRRMPPPQPWSSRRRASIAMFMAWTGGRQSWPVGSHRRASRRRPRNQHRGGLGVQLGSELGSDATLQNGQPVTVGTRHAEADAARCLGGHRQLRRARHQHRHRVGSCHGRRSGPLHERFLPVSGQRRTPGARLPTVDQQYRHLVGGFQVVQGDPSASRRGHRPGEVVREYRRDRQPTVLGSGLSTRGRDEVGAPTDPHGFRIADFRSERQS